MSKFVQLNHLYLIFRYSCDCFLFTLIEELEALSPVTGFLGVLKYLGQHTTYGKSVANDGQCIWAFVAHVTSVQHNVVIVISMCVAVVRQMHGEYGYCSVLQ